MVCEDEPHERKMGTSEMSRLDFWSLLTSEKTEMTTREISKIAAGRMILFDSIIQRLPEGFGLKNTKMEGIRLLLIIKPKTVDILEAIRVYMRITEVIREDNENYYMSKTFQKIRGLLKQKNRNNKAVFINPIKARERTLSSRPKGRNSLSSWWLRR